MYNIWISKNIKIEFIKIEFCQLKIFKKNKNVRT
jgi:hypothetical protein